MKTKLCFHLGVWLGETLIYTEKVFFVDFVLLRILIILNFTFFLSLNLSFFFIQIEEMFKRIAITLCRVFITQQNISTPLSA